MITQKRTLVLIFMFCCSLFLRALLFNYYFASNPIMLSYDAGQYHTIATKLIAGKGFTNDDGSRADYRVPGYPLFLAACYKVWGVSPHSALYVQLVLASFIPILLFFLVLSWFPGSSSLAYLSSIVACLHPGYLIYANVLMSETLFVIFLLLFFIFLGQYLWSKQSSIFLLLSGLALGGASLLRSVGPYVLIVTLLIFYLYVGNIRRSLASISVITFGWFLIISWWLLANFFATGYWYFDTLTGIHFLKHGAARIQSKQKNISYAQALGALNCQWKEKIARQGQESNRALYNVEKSRIAQQLALDSYFAYPTISILLSSQNMLKTIFGLYSSEFLAIEHHGVLPGYDNTKSITAKIMRYIVPKTKKLFVKIYIWFELCVHLFLTLGFFGFMCRAWYGYCIKSYSTKKFVLAKKLFIISLFYALFVFLSLACGYARFRLPVACFIIMLALYFWQSLFDMVKREGICKATGQRKEL